MYRSHWDRARPAYAAVARGANNVRGSGSEVRDDENSVEANNGRVLLLDRDDRLNTAARKQNAFVNKILLEAQRRQYAKGNKAKPRASLSVTNLPSQMERSHTDC